MDLHEEILLHLPPDEPKLLFRFAAVSRPWRDLICSEGFRRRYRQYHRVPPMIGCVYNLMFATNTAGYVSMIPNLPAPVLPRLPYNGGRGLVALDSHHGRVLFRRVRWPWSLVVWDPLAAHHEDVLLPAEFQNDNTNWSAGILCAAVPPCNHLNCQDKPSTIILIGVTEEALASAYVYSSATRSWTATASVPPPAAASAARMQRMATTVINDSMFFKTDGSYIIRYRFVREAHRLSYIEGPPEIFDAVEGPVLVPAVGGRLGFAVLLRRRGRNSFVRIWEAMVGAEGSAVAWEEQRPVTLSLQAERLLGSVERPRSLLIGTLTVTGREPMCLNLDTGEAKTLPKPKRTLILIPFVGFCTP